MKEPLELRSWWIACRGVGLAWAQSGSHMVPRNASCTTYSASCPICIATLLLLARCLHIALLLHWAALIVTSNLRAVLTYTLLLWAAGCWCGPFYGLFVLWLLCLLRSQVLIVILRIVRLGNMTIVLGFAAEYVFAIDANAVDQQQAPFDEHCWFP